eukprot:m.249906 g.249906  ORF g.249906 m.249906 type:complete len:321 (+) comp16420_c0_seq1:32-994(+)
MALTLEILGKSNKQTKRHRGESVEAYLARLTHVSVIAQGITQIEHLQHCPHLCSLYLYDNKITRIDNLHALSKLTHLYLQHNQISRIENLDRLQNLVKLHLGYNRIEVLEGLHGMASLRELHVEYQRLPEGAKLAFDPRSVEAIAGRLQVLNVAGNELDTLEDLIPCSRLTMLEVSNNKIDNLSDIIDVVARNYSLQTLSVLGNPLCTINKYREELIVTSSSLVLLDGKEISPSYRQFLSQWKTAIDRRRENSAPMRSPDHTLRRTLPPSSAHAALLPARVTATAYRSTAFTPSVPKSRTQLPPISRPRPPMGIGADLPV